LILLGFRLEEVCLVSGIWVERGVRPERHTECCRQNMRVER